MCFFLPLFTLKEAASPQSPNVRANSRRDRPNSIRKNNKITPTNEMKDRKTNDFPNQKSFKRRHLPAEGAERGETEEEEEAMSCAGMARLRDAL